MNDIKKGIISYCGWGDNNMNQLFRSGEYHDPNVESFQLEFRMTDCRREPDLKDTSEKLIRVFSSLVSPPLT